MDTGRFRGRKKSRGDRGVCRKVVLIKHVQVILPDILT